MICLDFDNYIYIKCITLSGKKQKDLNKITQSGKQFTITSRVFIKILFDYLYYRYVNRLNRKYNLHKTLQKVHKTYVNFT